ncbi:regulatory protein, luxR family [Aquimarina spongiae]|uniref:Regulatory protein, luxR family n=2 Tax=Aquimarina spongiae TaxID=570521 RepID=A0A1M6I1N1_9FLAO|nr:regulatory protein, luxR family [Aquimarina spongiae]
MKLKSILAKYQKYLLVIAIVISSIAVSIQSSEGKVKLVLRDYPFLIFLMVVISSFLVIIYIQITKRKIETLSDQIRNQSKTKSEEIEVLLHELTERQREVYNLILSGKTNKEIMSELFI